MSFRSYQLLLITLVLAASLSGCGLWDAWKQRTTPPSPPAEAFYDEPYAEQHIHPGHSLDPEVFNENYDPYGTGPERTRRFAPPPAPPVRPERSPVEPESHADLSPSTDGQLIRTLKTPAIFSPDGVRSIYDRLRGAADSNEETLRIKPDGPIAMRLRDSSETRACQYRQNEQGPVQLGPPEINGTHPGGNGAIEGPKLFSQSALVTQACPSCYKRPMLADPQGTPRTTD